MMLCMFVLFVNRKDIIKLLLKIRYYIRIENDLSRIFYFEVSYYFGFSCIKLYVVFFLVKYYIMFNVVFINKV